MTAGGLAALAGSSAVAGLVFQVLRGSRRPRRRLDRVVSRPARRPGRWWLRHPWRTSCLVALVGGSGGQLAGGAVAALLAAAYGGVAARWWISSVVARLRAEADRRTCDAVASLAADLRTGLAPAAALAAAGPLLDTGHRTPWEEAVARPVRAKVGAAWWLAENVGTPVADLLDRLDADLRSLARARAEATAQAAGARATALLLAALPAMGILLGYGVGADPLRVLLHTRTGAACAVLAVLLQVIGLAWSARLVRVIGGR